MPEEGILVSTQALAIFLSSFLPVIPIHMYTKLSKTVTIIQDTGFVLDCGLQTESPKSGLPSNCTDSPSGSKPAVLCWNPSVCLTKLYGKAGKLWWGLHNKGLTCLTSAVRSLLLFSFPQIWVHFKIYLFLFAIILLGSKCLQQHSLFPRSHREPIPHKDYREPKNCKT